MVFFLLVVESCVVVFVLDDDLQTELLTDFHAC